MNVAKKTLISTKNKIVRNKTKILGTIAVVATTAVAIQARSLKLHNQFLTEKGLFDEFYIEEDEA